MTQNNRAEAELLRLLNSTPGPGPWVQNAACAGKDPALFDAPAGGHRTSLQVRHEIARQHRAALVCASCPVLAACRTYRLETKAVGIWGGILNAGRPGHNLVDLIATRLHPTAPKPAKGSAA